MIRCARCFGDLPNFAVFCPHCAQIREPDFSQLITQTIGRRYRIYRRLGQGGLSSVFSATDLKSDRVVVIKVSDPMQLARRESSFAIETEEARSYWSEMLERMRLEAETLATIHHPNIVRFYGTGLINADLRYVVMEFLRGRTLRQELDAKGQLELPEAINIVLEAASALSEVHTRGIVHRDINPRNIFLEYGAGNEEPVTSNPLFMVKLIDFGIAKFPQPPGAPPFTQHSILSGTVAYASPEQCQSRPLDHRTDIYSLGIVLYELLTGQRPFNGRTPTEIALKQIQTEPTPPRAINPDLPASLEQTILRALAKNPDQRQQSVEDFATELRRGTNQIVIPLQNTLDERDESPMDEVTISSLELSSPEPPARLQIVRHRRRRITLAAATLLIVLTATGVLLGRHWTNSHPPAPTNQANIEAVSPSPTATAPAVENSLPTPGSDADSLELAARLSWEKAASGNRTAQPTTTPVVEDETSAKSPPPGKTKPSRATATRNTPSSPPRGAKPQIPPTPLPMITANRVPQPSSEPDDADAPRKIENNRVSRREDDSTTANNQDRFERDDSPLPPVNRSNGSGSHRRAPSPAERDEANDDGRNEDYHERIGPKLIRWSGQVNGERIIKIEMPGVPGTIEIPRGYLDRVGVVESPNPNNSWRCAVLRVFARSSFGGSVSILVRWWPIAGKVAKLNAQR